ncbi:50S ribosomal protein L35 [Candidatus Margulisiibacteriota bacterium]
MRQKIKTKKAAAKRIKITKSGKFFRQKAGGRHLLEHEDSGKKRGRRNLVEISDSDIVKIKKMLPNR